LKLIFLGTAEFALPSLKIILSSPHKIIAVVTQPDRPKGRGQKVIFSAVKTLAVSQNLSVLQPEKIRDPAFLEVLRDLHPELMVVVAYGQILSPSVLAIPPLGCINVHASLLPKYRGAAPIARAVLEGESKTGVVTMFMDAGMDTGPLLLREETPISLEDTTGTLHERLSKMGADLLLKTLQDLERGTLTPQPQDDSQASLAPKITKEEGRIRWESPAGRLSNLLRAFDPWPGAFTAWTGRTIKLFSPVLTGSGTQERPGTILQSSTQGLTIATGDGVLGVREVQLENRPRMSVAEFLKGHSLPPGVQLGA